MKAGRLLIGAAALAVLAGVGWFFVSPVAVATVAVTQGSVAEVVYATGVVEPLHWAKVIPLQRERIIDLCQECEGRPVSAGQVLARQDDTEERAALAELEARRAQLERDVQRLGNLLKQGATTQSTYDQTVTQALEYTARIAAARERVNALVLRSPLDGIVLRKDGEIGEIAGQSDVLFWVGQPKPLRVTAEVNEEDIPRVKRGQKVLLRNDGFGDQVLEARVGDITPKGDPANKTFRVYLTLPDDTQLHIGMSVEANIVVREKAGVPLLPAEALSGRSVMVVDEGKARLRSLQIGIKGTRMIEVLSGVAEGERIISPVPTGLKDGARVRVQGGG